MIRPIALALLLLAAAPVHAQDTDTGADTEKQFKLAAQRQMRERNQASDGDVHTGFAGSGVLVAASSDATDVSLTLSRSRDVSTPNTLSFITGSLKLTAPITDKDRQEGAFLTQSGLPDAIALEGTLTVVLTSNAPDAATYAERQQLYRARVADCHKDAKTPAASEKCDSLNFSLDAGEDLSDPWQKKPVWFLGFSAAVGRKNFDYRNLADFAEAKARRTEFAFSGYLGVNPNHRPFYLGAGYEYRRAYKDAKSRSLCPPAAAGAPQECFTGAFAEPERNVDSAVFAVARWQGQLPIDDDHKVPIGIALKASYDTKDKVFGIGLPIYLFSDGKGLRGGVRLDWQDVDDKDERLRFGLFIGTAFGLSDGS